MGLNKNITPTAENNFIDSHLSKRFGSFALPMIQNIGLNIANELKEPSISLSLSEVEFFKRLEQIRGAKKGNDSYVIVPEEKAFIVYQPDFETNQRGFFVFSRTVTEGIKAAAKDLDKTSLFTHSSFSSGTNLNIAVNGSFFAYKDDDNQLRDKAENQPLMPNESIPIGKVFSDGVEIPNVNSRSSPKGFHVQYSGLFQFDFGTGDATQGEGIGGLTPILLFNNQFGKVWKYGDQGNIYDPPSSSAPKTGSPGNFGNTLIIRNSSQYKEANSRFKGKTIFAYHASRDATLFISHENIFSFGANDMDYYRDKLFNLGFDFAVGFDGSNSSMLYEYSSRKFYVVPAVYKNNSITIGVVTTR